MSSSQPGQDEQLMEKLLRSRSAERDKVSDIDRLNRVSAVLTEVIESIDKERTGLRARYDTERERANSLLFTLEAEGPTPYLSNLLSTSESAMIYCDRRNAHLDQLSSLFMRSHGELLQYQEKHFSRS